MPCDDHPRHVNPNIPAGVIPHPGCSVIGLACHRDHYGHGDFEVCINCHAHTQLVLGFPNPAAALNPGAPFNLDRISAGWILPALLPGPGAIVNGATTAQQPGLGPSADAGTRSGIEAWMQGTEVTSGKVLPWRPRQPFPGFLTRVCDECEQLILLELMYRDNGPPQVPHRAPVYNPALPRVPMLLPELSQLQTWEHYPAVSCTCKSKLGISNIQDHLCKTHREEVWNELVKKRNINDEWLRNIEKRNGTIQWASEATKRKRVRGGYWRACRCGKEINHTLASEPDAYICMACEGYVSRYGLESIHQTGPLVVNHPLAVPPTQALTFTQWTKRIQPQRLKLNRHPKLSFQQVQDVSALP